MEAFRIQYRMSLNSIAISSWLLLFNVLVLPSHCHFTCTLLPIFPNCITFYSLPTHYFTNNTFIKLKRITRHTLISACNKYKVFHNLKQLNKISKLIKRYVDLQKERYLLNSAVSPCILIH